MKDLTFDFEQLTVWQKSMDFAVLIIDISENLASEKNHFKLVEQIESSSTSIAMNIAEGKGRRSKKSYVLHLTYARGSLYETLTLIEIFYRKKWIDQSAYSFVREESLSIVKNA